MMTQTLQSLMQAVEDKMLELAAEAALEHRKWLNGDAEQRERLEAAVRYYTGYWHERLADLAVSLNNPSSFNPTSAVIAQVAAATYCAIRWPALAGSTRESILNYLRFFDYGRKVGFAACQACHKSSSKYWPPRAHGTGIDLKPVRPTHVEDIDIGAAIQKKIDDKAEAGRRQFEELLETQKDRLATLEQDAERAEHANVIPLSAERSRAASVADKYISRDGERV